jgi:hypothetical protein
MKNRFGLVMLIATLFVASVGWSIAGAEDSLSCTPPNVDLSDLTPGHLSSAQLEHLARSYAAPEVRGLRSALDGYLAGDTTAYTRELLKPMASATRTLRSRFLLLGDEDGMYGGSFLRIQFRGHPEAVYTAWVFPLGGATYELRGWITTRCSHAQQLWLKAHYASSVDGG